MRIRSPLATLLFKKKNSSDLCSPFLFEYFSVAQRLAPCSGVLF